MTNFEAYHLNFSLSTNTGIGRRVIADDVELKVSILDVFESNAN